MKRLCSSAQLSIHDLHRKQRRSRNLADRVRAQCTQRYDAVHLRRLRSFFACNGRIDSPCPAPRGSRPHPHRGREMESDVEH